MRLILKVCVGTLMTVFLYTIILSTNVKAIEVSEPDEIRRYGDYKGEVYYYNNQGTSEMMSPDTYRNLRRIKRIDLTGAEKITATISGNVYRACCDKRGEYQNYNVYIAIDTDESNLTTPQIKEIDPPLTGTHLVTSLVRFKAAEPCYHCGGIPVTFCANKELVVYKRLPVIVKQPSAVTCDVGGKVQFNVEAKDAVSYVWKKRVGDSYVNLMDGENYGGSIVTGARTPTLSIENVIYEDNSSEYKCEMKTADGYMNETVAAVLSVNAIIETPPSDPGNTPGSGEGTTAEPTVIPTVIPTAVPTVEPTAVPTVEPTAVPTVEPTVTPTVMPPANPTSVPTVSPSVAPTVIPTVKPSETPHVVPTDSPRVNPTVQPTASPTKQPTKSPATSPTAAPTKRPSSDANKDGTLVPNLKPTAKPTYGPPSASSSSSTGISDDKNNPAQNGKTNDKSSSAIANGVKNVIPVIPADDTKNQKKNTGNQNESGSAQAGSNGPKSAKSVSDARKPKGATGRESGSSSQMQKVRTVTKDGIVYVYDDEGEDPKYIGSAEEYKESENVVLDDYYDDPGYIEGHEKNAQKSEAKLSGPLLYVVVSLSSLLGIAIIIFVLFFGVIVEGECEDKDEVFDFCFIRVVYRKDGKWCINLSEVFEENAVVRLKFGILFSVIFKEWEIQGCTTGTYEGEITELIEQKMLMYRRKIRRKL